MLREIVLDIETTGLEVRKGDRIIEIGAVEVVNKAPTGNVFHVYVNPKRNVSFGAYQIHGISDEFLNDKPVFARVAQDLIKFIAKSPIVIHNAQFDIGFINYELNLLGYQSFPEAQVFCTLNMARRKYPGAQNSLDALCKRFKISLENRTKHGALLDAELLARVYLHLCGGPQKTISFDENNGLEASVIPITKSKKAREVRGLALSEKEVQQHEEFIGKIKDSLWKMK